MPTPTGDITSTETWGATPDLELIQEEESVDTKGYSVKLIEKVADMVLMGGYTNQVAVNVIDLVTNWKEPQKKAVPK